jgi:hypothetical protein
LRILLDRIGAATPAEVDQRAWVACATAVFKLSANLGLADFGQDQSCVR